MAVLLNKGNDSCLYNSLPCKKIVRVVVLFQEYYSPDIPWSFIVNTDCIAMDIVKMYRRNYAFENEMTLQH